MSLTKEFVTAVRPVIAWARANGWEHDVYKSHYCSDAWKVRLMRTAIEVRPKSRDGRWWGASFEVPVASPQQAIDVLCALGVLPSRFSSQWREGYGQGRDDEAADLDIRDAVRANLAAAMLTPDAVPEFVEGHHVGGKTR